MGYSERDRRLVAEGEVDEAWRVAEEVAAEVDRLRAEKRVWEERERELTDALSAFSHPASGHRRGQSSGTVNVNGEGLRFVLTTDEGGEGGGGGLDGETEGRRLSFAASEDMTSASRLSRISRVSEAEVVPVTGKAVVSAARYVGALSPTEGEEGGMEMASAAASVGHGEDGDGDGDGDEEGGQSVEVKREEREGEEPPLTARPFPSTNTFKLPPAPTTSTSPPPTSEKGKEKASSSTPAQDLRPDHKRHKRASTTSQVSRVSAARTRSMRASKASLSMRNGGAGLGLGSGGGERRVVRRRASSVSSVPESGYGVEIRGGGGRKRRGSVDGLKAFERDKSDLKMGADKSKGKEAVKGRERKDSDAFSIASASSAAHSVQSRRREREKERQRVMPPVPALPVEAEGEGEEGSFLELGMMDRESEGGEESGEGEREGKGGGLTVGEGTCFPPSLCCSM